MSEVTFVKYPRMFRVATRDSTLFYHLQQFNKVLTDVKLTKQRGRISYDEGDHFFLESKHENSFFYNINLYKRVMEFVHTLTNRGYKMPINIIEETVATTPGHPVTYDRHNLNLIETHPDWVFQNDVVEFMEKSDDQAILEIQTGRGKALSLDTPIKTPGGWTQMGDIKLGDMVISRDGTATEVDGIFPQPANQLYCVTFKDGRTVECCGEHLWRIYYANTLPHKRWRTVDTLEMLRLMSIPGARVSVPLCEPELNLPTQEYIIPPYHFGVLLGDGRFGETVGIYTPDQYLIDKFESALPPELKLTHRSKYYYQISSESDHVWLDELTALKLTQVGNRFIPHKYLQGDTAQRTALLMGLMDADGLASIRGKLSYITVTVSLTADVLYLARSLGHMAKVTTTAIDHNGVAVNTIQISSNDPKGLFSLPRKRRRMLHADQLTDILKLQVLSVKKTCIKESQCISVKHPEATYVIKDFVVTHNTKLSLKLVVKSKCRVMYIVKKAFIEKWCSDIKENLNPRTGELVVINSKTRLDQVIKLGLADRLSPVHKGDVDTKVFIITPHVLDGFINEWVATAEGVPPYDLCKILGLDLVIYDEVHMLFRMNYISFLFLTVNKVVDLSATLKPDTQFNTDRFEERLPVSKRKSIALIKYIECLGLTIQWKDQKTVNKINRMQMYNHTEVEKVILRSKVMVENYFHMVDELVDRLFLANREPGEKCLVYFATKKMCTMYADRLHAANPRLKISRFIQGDCYTKFINADIGVSTSGKSGTAIDIPGLISVINTISVKATAANLQLLGRLRKRPGRPVRHTYVFAPTIRKQADYHHNKVNIFKDYVKTHRTLSTNFVI